MQRARFEIIGLALLALGLGLGCSSDGSGTEKGDGGSDGGNNGSANQGSNENGGEDAGENNGSNANNGNNDPVEDSGMKDSGPPDSGMCTPMYSGCDDKYPGVDPATLCGQIDNGCGVMIDCDPEDDNCAGFDSACNDPAKPNQCGCLPKTCENVVAGGAECGAGIDDGCGGTIATSCGTCPGAQDACTGGYKCECAPNLLACTGKVCGTKPDGCGNNSPCGPNAGACAVGDCSPDQTACTCPSRATACAGKTGPLTLPNGCTYDCTLTCGATENLAACNGAQCGTATNACGDVVNCGSNAGGCAGGQACVDKAYIEGATGNACLDENVANLLGGYIVRTHAFTDGFLAGFTKAESVSLVKIWKKANSSIEIIDTGCVASAFAYSSSTAKGTQSLTPSYFRVPAVIRTITQPDATSWLRPFRASPAGSTLPADQRPVALGFTFGLPTFCNGTSTTPTAAADFDTIDSDADSTPTPWSGSLKKWLGSPSAACTCPTTAQVCTDSPTTKDCFPAANGATAMNATDCRINDIDEDGLPGLTGLASNGAIIGAITAANIKWEGKLSSTGHHAGFQTEPNPLLRQIVSCTPASAGCGVVPNITSATCDFDSTHYNRVQFRKLTPTDFAGMSCGTFYNRSLDTVSSTTTWGGATGAGTAVNQTAIDGYFQGMQACGAGSTCPDGMKCNADNLCWPLTSPGACSGTTDTSCGTDWKCGYGDGTKFACWPQKPTGTACNN